MSNTKDTIVNKINMIPNLMKVTGVWVHVCKYVYASVCPQVTLDICKRVAFWGETTWGGRWG
jgi:hypothetical protein